MEQIILTICLVGAGYYAWTSTGNVLITIGAVILGGFVGSLIGFQIHQHRRMKELGFSTRRELNEFDRDMDEIRDGMQDAMREKMEELDEQARAEGYSSHRAKMSAESNLGQTVKDGVSADRQGTLSQQANATTQTFRHYDFPERGFRAVFSESPRMFRSPKVGKAEEYDYVDPGLYTSTASVVRLDESIIRQYSSCDESEKEAFLFSNWLLLSMNGGLFEDWDEEAKSKGICRKTTLGDFLKLSLIFPKSLEALDPDSENEDCGYISVFIHGEWLYTASGTRPHLSDAELAVYAFELLP